MLRAPLNAIKTTFRFSVRLKMTKLPEELTLEHALLMIVAKHTLIWSCSYQKPVPILEGLDCITSPILRYRTYGGTHNWNCFWCFIESFLSPSTTMILNHKTHNKFSIFSLKTLVFTFHSYVAVSRRIFKNLFKFKWNLHARFRISRSCGFRNFVMNEWIIFGLYT